MPWDDDNQNNKGPWGQNPNGGKPRNNKPIPEGKDELDELFKKGQEQMRKMFSGGGGGVGGPKGSNPAVIGLIVAIVFVFWLASGVYTVNTKEEGVVLRFGEYIRTTQPGLRYHLPTPIEKVIKLRVTDRYRTEIGYRVSEVSNRRSSRRGGDVNREILMLTGDENIVDVNFEVQWQISNAEKFLFNVYDPQTTVRDAAESAMREIIGTTPLKNILSEGRTVVQLETKELLQSVLDSYDIGIQIEEINMRGVPPKSSIRVDSITTDEEGNIVNQMITTTVDEAFKDVQAAIINKEETINSAIARSNEIIPQARGHAQKILQEAKGYKEKTIARAVGEASRFTAVYNEYRKAKNVTRKRIYLETMEEILSGMDKIVLDSKGSNGVVPYLPLNELNKK